MLQEGFWTATFVEPVQNVMLGTTGETVRVTRAENGEYWLGNWILTDGQIVTAEDGREYTLMMGDDGLWTAAPRSTQQTDDHGDAPSQATQIGLPAKIGGWIETADDMDWFRFEVSERTEVAVFTTGSLDTVGTLVNILSERDPWVVSDDNSGNSANFRIEAALDAGIYYVSVESRGDDPTGAYELRTERLRPRSDQTSQVPGTIATLAGSGRRGHGPVGARALTVEFFAPSGVASDSRTGDLYVADRDGNSVRRISPTGQVTGVWGTGEPGYSGDGGDVADARFSSPTDMAVDAQGNVYVADTGNHRVRRINSSGTIETIAGTGERGYGGDGRAAADAQLDSPTDVAVDLAGNVYVADSRNHRIRKIDSSGTITTFAGTVDYGYWGDGGPATEAGLDIPEGVAVDGAGNVYVADSENGRIRKIDSSGTITTLAGTGDHGYGGDGGRATEADLTFPHSVAVDLAGNVYVADSRNHRIRKIDSSGIITTLAGTGEQGYSGNGEPAAKADLNFPRGVAVDAAGNILVADTDNERVRRIGLDGKIETVAGTKRPGYGGDGGPAIEARLRLPRGVAADPVGNVYVADVVDHRVRRIDSSGTITTVAGSGDWGYGGDGGPAFRALVSSSDVAVDSLGYVYIADSANHRVRKVDSAGVITTIAGTGRVGYGGDGGPATEARLHGPHGVAVDGLGNVYIADAFNHRVRKVDSSGVITTIAGTGQRGHGGDGGSANQALLAQPRDVAVDSLGNVYVLDSGNRRVRKVDSAGVITTFAGTGGPGYGGDGGPATEAQLSFHLSGVTLDGLGNVYIAELRRVRRVDSAGVITTIAGTDRLGFTGDGGAATEAQLNRVSGVAADRLGNVYIAERRRVRVVAAPPTSGLPETDDHGDEASRATELEIGSSVAGRIDPDYDLDYFRLEVASAADIEIYTTGSLDTVGALEDGPGQTLASDDDGGEEGNFRMHRRLGPGAYYVRVESYGDSVGAYTLHTRVIVAPPPTQAELVIETLAGTGELGYGGDGGPAREASFYTPVGLAVDESGNLYVADRDDHRVRTVYSDDVVLTHAGTGRPGYNGDGELGFEAQLNQPQGVAVDALGSLYIADTGNHRIRRVDAHGEITTVAGTGKQGYGGDGGPATQAILSHPTGVAADRLGNVYIAEWGGYRVRRVDTEGVITTFAGTGELGYGGDGGPAHLALVRPADVAVDGSGNVYIADQGNHRVRKVDSTGVITTLAGTGERGYGGDGGPAGQAYLDQPFGVAVDGDGNVYIADQGNHRVRKVDSTGVITTLAGTGEMGYGGDGGPASLALFNSPRRVAADDFGNVYIADELNRRVRVVRPREAVAPQPPADDHGDESTEATRLELGTAVAGRIDPAWDEDWFLLELTRATEVEIFTTGSLNTVGSLQHSTGLYIRDSGGDGGNFLIQIDLEAGVHYVVVTSSEKRLTGSYTLHARVIPAPPPPPPAQAEPVIETLAGTGEAGYGGDGGPAVEARLNNPSGVAVDGSGNVYVADLGSHRVRRIDPNGVISTYAGSGEAGYGGDGGPAVEARLNNPSGVAVDGSGNVYVADLGSHRVRRIDPNGVISTYAGSGEAGYGGDGGPAVEARLNNPFGVAVDGSGNVFVTEFGGDDTRGVSHRVRRIDSDGTITTYAGSAERGYGGDGGPAADALLFSPAGVATDQGGNVFVADYFNGRVRRIDRAGVISTYAGTGRFGHGGDGGPAVEALLAGPFGVAVDVDGNLFVTEYGSDGDPSGQRVRRIASNGVISTYAGTGQLGYGGDGGPAVEALLARPSGVAVDKYGNVYVADTGNHRVRVVRQERAVPPSPAVVDHGDEPEEATRLELGTAIAGRIDPAWDEDWFLLELTRATAVEIFTTGSLDTVGTLYDSSGQTLASDDDGGEETNFRIRRRLDAGVHYVRVESFGNGAVGRYTLHARVQVTGPVGRDYDSDDNGLIEVASLEQLNAIRWDLDGDGTPTSATPYESAFPRAVSGMGCPADGCAGYELVADLDFDTNDSGRADEGDAYWNDGLGWAPIGGFGNGFSATFDGNDHTVSNLYIYRNSSDSGLFGTTETRSDLRRIGLIDVHVSGPGPLEGLGWTSGGLVGLNGGAISDSYVSGDGSRVAGGYQIGGLVGHNVGPIARSYTTSAVTGIGNVGGLVGSNGGPVTDCYATGNVNGVLRVGGLVGGWHGEDGVGPIIASYAAGDVTGDHAVGGLVGSMRNPIVASYAAGDVTGDRAVGGLVGETSTFSTTLTASYSIGKVVGNAEVGGLVGYNFASGLEVTDSYWDIHASGQTTSAGGVGMMTSELQSPTGYAGIYAEWNLDVDGDGSADDPWDFGASDQYPVLKGALFEHGDDPTEATHFELGRSVEGRIAPATDIDYFRLEIASLAEIEVYTAGSLDLPSSHKSGLDTGEQPSSSGSQLAVS